VALAAWLEDNRDLAQRALAEAVRRDDEKTSLFFALISRRAGRSEANRTWLDRYFGLQNPHQLDRQTVVMVDAMANGVFNADTTQLCSKRITAWIEELSQQAGFAEAQRSQWSDALRSKTPHADHADDYPHLSRFSPTWGALGTSLNEASMQSAVLQHFEQVFQGEIKPASSVLVAVDDLLTKLVTRFDDEELPLRRQEELCRLIIEESGDKRAAQSRYDLQSKTLDTQVDFTQLLTNAAMHPETSHVTRATQRFAIAHSRDWILDAHSDVTAKARQKVPQRIELQLEDWSGQTSAGENEAELLASLASHLDQREAEALAGAKLGLKHWGAVAIGAVLVLMSVSYGMVSLVLGLAALGWAYLGHRTVQKLRIKIREDFARLKTQSAQALRACMAETVELRRDLAQRDGVSANVTALLESISPAQHLLSGHDNAPRHGRLITPGFPMPRDLLSTVTPDVPNASSAPRAAPSAHPRPHRSPSNHKPIATHWRERCLTGISCQARPLCAASSDAAGSPALLIRHRLRQNRLRAMPRSPMPREPVPGCPGERGQRCSLPAAAREWPVGVDCGSPCWANGSAKKSSAGCNAAPTGWHAICGWGRRKP
jgi:hypothetical protein